MATQRRKPAGDATGRAAERLAAEHAEEIKARAQELSMQTAVVVEQKETEVVDYSSGAPVVEEMTEDEVIEYASDEREDFSEPVDLAPPPQRSQVIDLGQETAQHPTEIIRVTQNLDEITIGYGNVYTFEEGRKYRVPAHVALHLKERGLIYERY